MLMSVCVIKLVFKQCLIGLQAVFKGSSSDFQAFLNLFSSIEFRGIQSESKIFSLGVLCVCVCRILPRCVYIALYIFYMTQLHYSDPEMHHINSDYCSRG